MATTLFIDQLTVLDYAYLDPELGVRGESLEVSAELHGEPDDLGFIVDFGVAKRTLKRLVDESIDHRCVVPRYAKDLTVERLGGETTRIVFGHATGVLRYECPDQAVTFVDTDRVTSATLVAALERSVRAAMPARVGRTSLRLSGDPSFDGPAGFRYTHGLKHHDGNCQRLLHGHSSQVEVRVDGAVDLGLAAQLARELAHAHLVHARDVPALAQTGLEVGARAIAAAGATRVSYRSAQGLFDASLPTARLVVLDREPTVENLAAFGHAWLARRASLDPARLTVTVHEGFHKGARCSGSSAQTNATRLAGGR